ncbi:hypothetical protein LCGC14_2985190 [marine sediment metagenome]|uniref:Uncharacterized protein n=1 Tax=marine sediment metagenome TaxID=412755 RepID=A0A0F8ZWK8_9ZZZZ
MRGIWPAIALLVAVSGCMALPGAQAPKDAVATRIMTEAEFRQAVVGRRLMLRDAGSFVILSDGSLWGNDDTGPVEGSWHWERGAWCVVVRPPGGRAIEDCQHWETLGNGFRATRRRGAGSSYYLPVG